MDNDLINLVEIVPEVEAYENATTPIIKVLGVGGGGSNAAKHMYNMGIVGVDFVICNTDRQALEGNPIPIKIQLGDSGLGAGAKPDVAREAALKSEERIKKVLEGTKMVFITAGMGGGTGTGASPIIASIAREMGILTVGIVTYPFCFEQKSKFKIAEDGINELGANVDALIVIKNEALKSFYPDLKINNAFAKSNDVLLIAAKSIAELITLESIINVDFNDVDTILRNSGTAIIGSGEGEGEDRAMEAIEAAVNSPLLDTNSIHGARKVLFFISYSHENELSIEELSVITDMLENKTCSMEETLIWGHGYDDTLGEKVRVTVIATHLEGTPPPDYKRSQYNQKPSEPTDEPQETAPPATEKREHSLFPPPIENRADNPPLASTKQEAEPQTVDANIDNNALRNLNDIQMQEFLKLSAYERNRLLQEYNSKKNEISNFQVGSNGVEEHTSCYLSHLAD